MFVSIAWVPRGRLLNNPLRYQATEEDEKAAKDTLNNLKAELAVNDEGQEDYGEEERDTDDTEEETGAQDNQKDTNARNLPPNETVLPDRVNDDDDEEQGEQFQLVATDNMLVCARSAELGFVDCLVYNRQSDDFFFHHNFLTTSIPLSVAYLDFIPQGNGAAGNFCAVSTCSPEIEIWNLDMLDTISPVLTLGGFQEVAFKPKRSAHNHYIKTKKTKQFPLPGSHKDHVLTLSWSPQHRNILASGSADETIKLWDLNTAKCIATFSSVHSGGPVSCVLFNPFRPGLLASTCLGDRKVAIIPFTTQSPTPRVLTVLKADPEQLDWLNEDLLCCTTEMGELLILDTSEERIDQGATVRASLFPLQEYAASLGMNIEKVPLTGLAAHPVVKGLIAVGGPEICCIALCAYISGSLTLLHVQLIASPVFSLAWCTGEDSLTLAVGSSNSVAYILQPFSWTMQRPIQEVFGIQIDVQPLKEHRILVEDEEKDVEDD